MNIVSFVLSGARFAVLTIMSVRDIRERIVLDRDLAWFAFFNTLPLLLSRTYPDNLSLPPFIVSLMIKNSGKSSSTFDRSVPVLSPLPLWLAQLIFLVLSTGGALFLFLTSLALKRISSKEMIGDGDILFSLAAGLGSDYTVSLRMVLLAFVLAMPVAVIIKCARRTQRNIAFIPFLALAFLCLEVS